MRSPLYKFLVCPVLKSAAPVWIPYLSTNVLAKQFHFFIFFSASSRAKMWGDGIRRSFKEAEVAYTRNNARRLFLSLVERYKIVFGINKPNFDDLF